MNEEVAAQNYLLALLGDDATLQPLIHGVTLRTSWGTLNTPFIKIDRLDATDVIVIGLHRVWADMTFLVRGIVKWDGRGLPNWAAVQQIADRLDELLHDHEGTGSGVEIHSFRDEPFTDETVEVDDLYLHAGGIYRVRARALAAV